MARNSHRKQKRNNDIRAFYKQLYEKNKIEKKYRMDYLVELTATKFYLQPRSIYEILRETPAEDKNQLKLFEPTPNPSNGGEF
jgi:hypothetical protein